VARVPNLDGFPAELRSQRRWVAWRYVTRYGKTTKKPLQSVAKPSAWLSVAQACDFVARGAADGVGIVLGDGVVGIDLDGCFGADGALHEMAREAIALGTYVERSPSRRGLHCLIRATISRSRKIGARGDVPGREVYDGGRYFTVTGDRIGSAMHVATGPLAQVALDAYIAKWFPKKPDSVEAIRANDDAVALDDGRVLQVMFGATDGANWRTLFDGDHSRYPSQSEADLGLCGKLRFFTRANAVQMDRLFRLSGLMRSKWDERHGTQTYGERTIATAISKGGPCYVPRSASNRRDSCEAKERKAYGKCPLWWVVQLKGAGELAIRVLWIITSYADPRGEAFPSVETIALHARVSERRVRAAIAKLKALGILASTYRPRRSNLYQLALRVPETITHDATHREAPRVTEPGHLGCPSLGTVTNQELTTNKHRREKSTQLEDQSTHTDREEERSVEASVLPQEPSGSPTVKAGGPGLGVHSPYDGWDGTTNTAKGRDLLWKFAEEKLGLAGRVVMGSDVFCRPYDPTQPELGL